MISRAGAFTGDHARADGLNGRTFFFIKRGILGTSIGSLDSTSGLNILYFN